VSIDEQTGVRLQDEEKVLLALRETSWEGTLAKIVTLGLYVLWWNVKWYVVTDRRLVTKKGIFSKTEVALPLHFVQDVSVHCSPYNTGSVKISTAGGPEGVSRIKSLKAADARQLADTIMSQARRINVDVVSTQRGTGDVSEALSRLASLRDTGVLTEAEFAEQKARLLQSGS
jgi:uncharacterized membrane protein YdbT with pleckstrin-like domain